jgi:putative heme-binding domain-containing protein
MIHRRIPVMRLVCYLLSAALCSCTFLPVRAADADTLGPLVEVLGQTDDPQFQLDVLKGLSDGLKGRRGVPMPAGWEGVATKLGQSPNAQVRELVQSLSLTFGSASALTALRQQLLDAKADPARRRNALDSLLAAKDPTLAGTLHLLLNDPALRGAALRGLAAYDDAKTPAAILAVYPSLSGVEKKDALGTMVARAAFAKVLLSAVGGAVPARDLSADLVRQLRQFKDTGLNQQVEKLWGVSRESAADKVKEIERYKALIKAGPAGDAPRGRVVFARTCQQCHTFFDVGGKVGPDITGSNRADLDYVLHNAIDPNAEIPNDYRTSNLETKDDRVITGIVKSQDAQAVSIVTPNETLLIQRSDIKSLVQGEISMMPEGLLQALAEQEVRDLVAYLASKAQVALPATAETVGLFFNGKDLTNWDGDSTLWRVENGELVGKSTGLKRNEFLRSHLLLSDFRLIVQVKLTPNNGNSGIQFRSEVLPNGLMKGCQADVGVGWWGKLYEEHARGLLWKDSGEAHVRLNDWNTYEVLAVGGKVRTAINGKLCVDLDDAQIAKSGVVGFQLHSGNIPFEVRYKDLQLELSPKFELKTAK